MAAVNPLVPVPPENVRLLLRDHREIPVECVYLGRWDDVHVWEAVRPTDIPLADIDCLRIGMLPPHTEIGLVTGQ